MPDDFKIKPEYVLIIEKTPHWGTLGIALSSNGLQLNIGRVVKEEEKKAFYRLMGVSPEYASIDDSQTKVMRADPKMPLWIHGQQRELGDVVDSLYGQSIGIGELQELENSKRTRKYEQAVNDLHHEVDAARQSLLRAGVIRGIFPEWYGLPS